MQVELASDMIARFEKNQKSLCSELGIANFKESEEKLIRQVEQLTKVDVWNLMYSHDLQYHSEDFIEYSEAKRIVFRGLWINEEIYDTMIDWICEYLNV